MSPKKKSSLHRINTTNSMPLRMATGGMLAVLAVGGTVAATNHKDVSLDVNGEQINTTAWSGDVRDLLADNDIEFSDKDLITPGLDESVENNSTISVRSARQVSVTVDGQLRDIDTTSLTVSNFSLSWATTTPTPPCLPVRTPPSRPMAWSSTSPPRVSSPSTTEPRARTPPV